LGEEKKLISSTNWNTGINPLIRTRKGEGEKLAGRKRRARRKGARKGPIKMNPPSAVNKRAPLTKEKVQKI